MKLIERILWVIVALALVMKVLHLPLSSLLLIVSISVLNMLYFFLSWLLFPQPTRQEQMVWLSVLAGVFLSTGLTGVLFKLQLWPLSGFYLLVGGTSLAIVIVLVLLLRGSRPELDDYMRGLLRRAVPMLVACIALYALPNATLTAFYYRDDPEMGRLMIRYNSSDDPGERIELGSRIDSLQQARMRGEVEMER